MFRSINIYNYLANNGVAFFSVFCVVAWFLFYIFNVQTVSLTIATLPEMKRCLIM